MNNSFVKKPILLVLVILLGLLQYKLWFAPGNAREVWQLHEKVNAKIANNLKIHQRNTQLAAEVQDLKQGNQAIEERARTDLGMIKKGEKFYRFD